MKDSHTLLRHSIATSAPHVAQEGSINYNYDTKKVAYYACEFIDCTDTAVIKSGFIYNDDTVKI